MAKRKKSRQTKSVKKAAAKSARRQPTSKSPSSKSPASKSPAKRAPKAKLSALAAAAKVLGQSKQAMNCQELVEAMARQGYWKSAHGKTPERTLSAAIRHEITKQGKTSRFRKVQRGRFTLA